MNTQHLSNRLREAGYELALSDNWQKVKVSGSSTLSAPLRAQLKAVRRLNFGLVQGRLFLFRLPTSFARLHRFIFAIPHNLGFAMCLPALFPF